MPFPLLVQCIPWVMSFKKSQNIRRGGFSLLEILIALAIGLILLGTVFFFIGERRRSIVLNLATEQVANVIHDARTKAMSSYFDSDYGVFFGVGEVTIFQGDTYNANKSSNSVSKLPAGVIIKGLEIAGSASTTVFLKPRGLTNNLATVTVGLLNNETASTTLIVNGFGTVSRYEY